MLPQTNLQLYQLLIRNGAQRDSLAQVRTAYDVCRRLFAGAYRPSHKPFVCHLIGTAGALTKWNQPVQMIVAGLVHSAYLYGQFNDGSKGASAVRREWLRSIIGSDAEELVYAYTIVDWKCRTATELGVEIQSKAALRQLTTIKLADLLDEFSDNGTLYSPAKTLEFGLHLGPDKQAEVSELVKSCVGADAEQDFRNVFADLKEFPPLDCLRSDDRSFHIAKVGVPELARPAAGRLLSRLKVRYFKRRSANVG